MVLNPPSYADIRLITGEQRSGKSNTCVAYPIDDYYANMTQIVNLETGEALKAQAIDEDCEYELAKKSIFPDKLKFCRIWDSESKRSKIVRIPKNFVVLSPVKIFANFHLYGLKYAFITLEDIIQYLNSDMLVDCWVLSDESVMSDARNSMSNAGFIMATFAATIGKRNIHFLQNAQYNGMVDKRIRVFATTTISCTYEERTREITCEVKHRSDPLKTFTYYAPLYWPFFDTTERVKVPEKKLARALASIQSTQ